MYIYYDKLGRVKMVTQTKLKNAGKLTAKLVAKPKDFDDNVNKNAVLLYKGDKIEYEKSVQQVNEEKEAVKAEKATIINEALDQLSKSNSTEVRLIAKIISNLI